MKAIKVRIYPTKAMETHLDFQLEQCRHLYNRILDLMNSARKNNVKLSQTLTQTMITIWKQQDMPQLKHIYSKVLQMVNYTLWANIKGLAQLKKKGKKIGKLRFKGKGWYKVLNFNQSGFKVGTNQIHFSKLGWIKANLYRTLPGLIKGILIKHERSGKWYAILQVDTPPTPLPPTGKSVGLDVGLNHLVADSDGHIIENPKNLAKSMQKLKNLHKNLSRKQLRSSNYHRTRVKLAKFHETITNQRRDVLHKLSTYYIRHYDTICVEDLEIIQMLGHSK